ncbi:MAG: hypothetical protein M3P44_11175 [Actinomycetota bacterium]|nr:hypothetical protein [Actinomycetota bacterium]
MIGRGLVGCCEREVWVADSNYFVAVADDRYTDPSGFDGGWTACIVPFALTAW